MKKNNIEKIRKKRSRERGTARREEPYKYFDNEERIIKYYCFSCKYTTKYKHRLQSHLSNENMQCNKKLEQNIPPKLFSGHCFFCENKIGCADTRKNIQQHHATNQSEVVEEYISGMVICNRTYHSIFFFLKIFDSVTDIQ